MQFSAWPWVLGCANGNPVGEPPNKPMKLTRSPQGHVVESRRRLGGDRAGYRQGVSRANDPPSWLTRHGLYPILVNAMPTVFDGDFEWDSGLSQGCVEPREARRSFPEASTVFADPYAVYLDDGSGIGRLVVIGTSLRERLLYVVHVERGERDRIISARPATGGEREVYETGGHS